jgi:flagellar hook-basal body complex protein FliE
MSIPAVGAVGSAGFTPYVAPTLPTAPTAPTAPAASTAAVSATGATSGTDFSQLLSQGLQHLQGLHTQTDQLALKAATGDLNALHDYTITATEASVATQLTTAVRNKALEAFQEIMRMSV